MDNQPKPAFTFVEDSSPFAPDQSQARASKPFGPTIAPSSQGFSFVEGSEQPKAPARSLEEWKKDPSRGFTFGSEGEQRAERLGPTGKQALSGLGSAADTMTLGWGSYLPAAGAKGLGKLGVEGYQSYADMPLTDIVKKARGVTEAASEEYPKTSAAGTVAGIGLSAPLLPPVARGAGPFVSGAATGITYGALQGLSENLDPSEAIRSAVFGGVVGGVASPVLERVASGIGRLASMGKNVVDHNGLVSPEVAELAKAEGLSNLDILRLGPRLGAAISQYGMRPEAVRVAQFGEFGMTPTKGMVTKSPEMLEREAQYAGPMYEGIQQQAGKTAERLYGPTAPIDESVESAAIAARDKALAAKNMADIEYQRARDMDPLAFFSRDSISDLGSRIGMEMSRDPQMGNLVTNDAAKRALKRLDETVGAEMIVRGPLVPGGKPVTTVNQGFASVESGRQALNAELAAAMKAGDGEGVKAIRNIIDRFDDNIESAMTNGAFSGDPAVVDQWRNARGMWRDYQEKFGVKRSGEESGSLIKDIIDKKRDPSEVGSAIFNFSSGDPSMKQTAMKTIGQLNRALGPNSPEMQGIKASFINDLMNPAGATPKDFARTAERINDFLEGKGSSVARRFLSDKEREVLSRFSKVMENAGSMPKDQLQKNVSVIAETAKMMAPSVLSGASYVLGIMHPALAVALGAAGYVPGTVKAVKSLPVVARRAANAPFTGKGTLPPVPSMRAPLAVAAQKYPEFERALESANQETEQQTGLPMQRASGGRTVNSEAKAKADKLIAMVERVRKDEGKDTSSLLNLDDTTVAKALAVANRGI